MSILDNLEPAHYKVIQMSIVVDGDDVNIRYRVRIFNESGVELGVVEPESGMTPGEISAVKARYLSDKALFESATGLTEL